MELDASVVIPAFNKRGPLELALAGFGGQEYPADRYEVIVVDDGSTDETEAWLTTQRLPCVLRYLRQDNSGMVGGTRRGDPCRPWARIIVMTDADYVPVRDFVAQHVRAHEGREDTVVVGRKLSCLARWYPVLARHLIDTLAARCGSTRASDR